MPGGINKAYFEIEGQDSLTVQFNPSEYSITEEAQYGGRKSNEKAQYVGNKMKTLHLTFYLDTSGYENVNGSSETDESDVTEVAIKYANLAIVDGDKHRPPIVKFVWGSIHFQGLVTKVQTSFTLFNGDGKPVRAKITTDIQEYWDETHARVDPLLSPDRTKRRIISEDTNVWNLAEKEYGDINKWRLIAKANQILDPLEIPNGTVLKVPALEN
ncbi:CIS tube protein [Anaeromicropila populeti]|uniref:Contractile injection system tube protein N-terminal domain-containing protein n=1 Tax=Anaeromicropila populeti TaxID=37658 RepID=A0A1I6LTL4_9FIRM|nr:hypothetical protein [Anaeromicropila populeti]SFS06779.1 hypothetical protein SAMN05661086_03551 [Anaeromicropila populeti]